MEIESPKPLQVFQRPHLLDEGFERRAYDILGRVLVFRTILLIIRFLARRPRPSFWARMLFRSS
jgi:hypothetical protein